MNGIRASAVCALLWAAVQSPVLAAEVPAGGSSMPGVLKSLQSLRFSPDDDVKCLGDALESGDPAKGPSTILLKASPGCLVPWHYHTAMEQVTVIRGRLTMEMTGHSAVLTSGGFASMPGKMAHQFTCSGKEECLVMVMFDRAYDIFWGKGN
jgi:quercetin dioxygenase-like cupin family protein